MTNEWEIGDRVVTDLGYVGTIYNVHVTPRILDTVITYSVTWDDGFTSDDRYIAEEFERFEGDA